MTTLSTPSATTRRGRGLTWARVQAGSALVFLVFAALHLVNTALGAVSVEAYNGFQRALRPFYQHPVLELFAVLGPLAVHMFASVVRMRQRRSSHAPRSLHARAHRYAGYLMLQSAMSTPGFRSWLPGSTQRAIRHMRGVARRFV